MFVDHIKVHAKAGDGGRGCVSFRRESFVPKGGPDGGDGGRGGSVILRADSHTDNLTPFFYEPIIRAKSGQHGRGKQCYGKSAADRIVPVPVGTIVYRLPQEMKGEGLEASVAYGSESTFVDLSKAPEDLERPGSGLQRSQPNPAELEMIADLTETGQEFVLCKGGKGRARECSFQKLPQSGADTVHGR
jgi:GTP-binding protein